MVQLKSFPAIEGMRVIFNFWIVALHQHMAQKTILAVHKRMDLLEHISASVWPGLALGNGYQVDVFFMLSAFLFTWSVIGKGDNMNSSLFTRVKTIGLFVVKRVLRLWPVLITVLAFAAALDDYGARNPVAWVRSLMIPTYFDDMPQAVVPGWSNRTDIENCVTLFGVITVLQWTGCLNSYTAVASVALSLIPKAWRFLADPDTYSYMRLAEDVMTTAVTLPHRVQDFYRDVLFKGKLGEFETIDTVTRMTPMFYGEYIVTHQRWSPAFVGFALAVCLRSAYREYERSKGQKEPLSLFAKIGRVLSRLVSFVTLLFSILLAALPILMALSPATAEVRATTLANPPIEADFVVSVLGRTLNAAGWGYLLYRCLLPKGHPLRLNYLAALLELPVFQFVGQHTYCIYMLHYVFVHFVAYSILSPARMEAIVGPLSADTLLLELILRTVTSYGLTFLLAISIVRYIEQPLLAVLQRTFKRLEVGGAAKKD